MFIRGGAPHIPIAGRVLGRVGDEEIRDAGFAVGGMEVY
jgi:hypothetical protein